MKVLIACEFSGTVRDAFLRRGHDAWSCDIIDSENGGPHYKIDVREVLHLDWDLMVAHPPCTHLAVSGAAWFKFKEKEQREAIDFFLTLANAPIPQIALENPVGVLSSLVSPPTQIVQPYWFGDEERKTTCLWLKSLPSLVPTNRVEPVLVTYPNGKTYPRNHDHFVSKGQDRGRERSRMFPGMAEAMAEQWGSAQDYSWRSRTGCRIPWGLKYAEPK